MIRASQIVEEARSWIGAPFQHQGRARHGVDCVGLLIMVGKACGALPGDYDYNAYPRTPQRGVMLRELMTHCLRVQSAEPGTLIVCQWHSDPQHVAFVAEDRHGLTLIHALEDKGRVVEHRYDGIWKMTTAHVFALNGVEYGR